MEVGGERHALAPLAKGKLGTHSIGVWVVPRTGLDGSEKKTHPHRDSIFRSSSP
jgi:hypothetical protein